MARRAPQNATRDEGAHVSSPGSEGAHGNSPIRSSLAREVILILQRNLYRLDFPDVPPAALENMKTMRGLAEEMAKLLHPISQAKLIEGRELWDSLTHAVVAIAKAKRAVRLNAKDLKDLIENHCPEPHMAFWLEQSVGAAVGLLRYEPQVRKLIEAQAVLFWDMDDDEWRVINTRWLEAHADIRRWVTEPWAGGRRCRFCGCIENPHVNSLLSVDIERRNGVQMAGDTVVLQVGGAVTHDPCRKHWIAWCAIAAKYSSQAQAEEADKAAGRVSRYQKIKEAARLEARA